MDKNVPSLSRYLAVGFENWDQGSRGWTGRVDGTQRTVAAVCRQESCGYSGELRREKLE